MTHGQTAVTSFDQALDGLVRNLNAVDQELALDRRTSPEDQLKTPLSNFLTEVASTLPGQFTVATEHRQVEGDVVEGVRLDLAVKRGRGQLIGHVELKAPSKSANPYRKSGWTKHDKDQWKRLEHHPNLVYSNGWEWSLLRHGLDRPLAHIVLSPSSDGSVSTEQASALRELLEQFLSWKPLAPRSPKALADQLAPLTSFLRDSVISVLSEATEKNTGLPALYQKWRTDLIPGATHRDFADSFAQTFTYALLLARIESDHDDDTFTASAVTESLLRNGHKLIGSVLELMAQPANRGPVESAVGLLEAAIGAVDARKLSAKTDPWLYFYEDFLSSYDPKMRNDAGVYYTPVEIVRFQVRLLDEILRTRFGRERGLGSNDVNILDPAVGTGAYPLAVAESVLNDSASPQSDARSLAERLFGFELLVGPYSVAHLRLTQMLEQTGIERGREGVQVYLTNTLTDPGDISDDYQQISFWEIEQNLNEETRKAGLVKNQRTKIRAILGNPPYDRGSRAKTLGTGSERFPNIILQEVDGNPPLLDDFINPLKKIGAGGQAKNLYNSYVYFIRWAIWKACEQHKDEAGVVSFITSSSYLRGPGFAGMREYMRRVFDEIWIVDLGGEGRGSSPEENVFSIRTPVAILFGIQREKNSSGSLRKHSDRVRAKAKVYYTRITGTAKAKLAALNKLQSPQNSDGWTTTKGDDWHSKFVPNSAASMAEFPPLDWVFPWSFSGSKAGRTWVIAGDETALRARLQALQHIRGMADAPQYFDNSPSGRQYNKPVKSALIPGSERKNSIAEDEELSSLPIQRYGYRSFNRSYCIADHRLVDRPGSAWGIYSEKQLYFTTLTSTRLGAGPAMTVSPYVPDFDFFSNRGAKDIHPLYRTNSDELPNVSARLLHSLKNGYDIDVTAEQVAYYTFGLLGTGAYTTQFRDELEESAARVPFTTDYELFRKVAGFGRSLIFEATWGERGSELNEFGQPTRSRFKGQAEIHTETPPTPYPDEWIYEGETRRLIIGGYGIFENVLPEVMEYSVSGLEVVSSWLGYRMKVPAGKSSSPLDRIPSNEWHFDRELLELLWQVEYFLKAEIEGAELLSQVVSGELIPVAELGPPLDNETKAPSAKPRNQETVF